MGNEGTGSLESLRDRNRKRVLDALRSLGVTSRAELARRTGLSRTTVSSLMTELLADGLVIERESQSSLSATPAQGGRPPVLVALDRSAGVAVGVDIGKSHVTVAVADLAHTILAETSRPLGRDHDAEASIAIAADLVSEALTEAGHGRSQVIGIGMGLPGPIEADSGEVGSSTILPGWAEVNVARLLAERLGIPVAVDNDANLGARAEMTWGAGAGVDNVVYIKLSTGIGAGLVFDGRLYTGSSGTAGEFGHTIVDEHGPVCRCANRGCLETLASGAAIVALLRPLHGNDLTLPHAIELAQNGDAASRRVLADAARHIGRATSTLVNLLNPARIVIGGDLAACGELLIEPLRQECRRHAIRSAADHVEVIAGQLGDRAEVLGAVALVLQNTGDFAISLPTAAASA